MTILRQGAFDAAAIAEVEAAISTAGTTLKKQLVGTAASDTIGFYGASPVAQQASADAGTNAATTQTLANALRTALINLGFIA